MTSLKKTRELLAGCYLADIISDEKKSCSSMTAAFQRTWKYRMKSMEDLTPKKRQIYVAEQSSA